MKNLIFTCTGPGPGTVAITKPTKGEHGRQASWDLAELLWHPDMIKEHREGNRKTNADIVLVDTDRSKRKFISFADAWLTERIPHDYDAYMLADDDLTPMACMYGGYSGSGAATPSGGTWQSVFDLFHEANRESSIDIAQPALTTDSTKAWPVTHRHWAYKYRVTDFVEVMCPVFSRRVIEGMLPYFCEERNGWGLEALWHTRYAGRLGILDATPIRHVRPVMSAHAVTGLGYDPEVRASEFRKHHGLTFPPWPGNMIRGVP